MLLSALEISANFYEIEKCRGIFRTLSNIQDEMFCGNS